jgi:hypothetical protein
MHLYWGVHPVRCPQACSVEQMVIMAEQDLLGRGVLKPKDVLGVVAGTRQASGSTNFMRLHTVTQQEAERIVDREPASLAADPFVEHNGSGEEAPSGRSSEARTVVL